MSFQYINPYLTGQQAIYQNPNFSYVQNFQFVPYQYVQNPFETSFYSQSVQYPYNNPLFQPSLNVNNNGYISLGKIKSTTGEDVHLFQLNNGQKVAIMPRKNQSTIVKTFLDAGSMNETDNIRGISHVQEHMLFKGASKLEDGDVFKLTGMMGASTNASTDYAQTDYYITAPFFSDNNFQKVVEIQGDMISNPKNDAKALESEKGPICSEISMCDDDIYSMALDRAIRNLFQIKSDSHDLVAGSIQTVQNLTRDDLVKHHKTYYDPKDLYTVVVGDVDVDSAIDLISKNFTIQSSGLEKHYEEVNPIQTSKREDVRSSKTNSTNVVMAFAGPKAKDAKDFIIADMINFYLTQCSTSDFKKKLEDINAGCDFAYKKVGLKDDDPYALLSLISLNPNDEQKGIDAFYDAVIKLQNADIEDDDLLAMKKYIEKTKLLDLSDSNSLCDLLGKSLMDNSVDLFTNYHNIANSITKEDIQNFAKKYFDLNKVSMLVVHPTSVSVDDINKNYDTSKYSLKAYQKAQNTPLIASYILPETQSNTQKTNLNQKFSAQSFTANQTSSAFQLPQYSKMLTGNLVNTIYPTIKEETSTEIKKEKSTDFPDVNTDGVSEYQMPNNTHLAINKSDSDLCVYSWSVDTPPIKPKNPNIPAVLAYMFQKGSEYKNQNELERYKELNGIDASVEVYGKSIDIYANCAPEDASKTLDLLYELLYHPKLTQNDFDQAKKVVKENLLLSQKDASSNLLDKIYPGFFPTKNTMLKAIDELTLDDVKEFYNQLLKSASSSFAATLPLDKYPSLKQETIDFHQKQNLQFQESIRKLTPIFKENPKANVIYDTDDLNQAQIYKSYQFPLSGNIEDEAKFELLNTILGGDANARLFSDLRSEQNLAYSVYSNVRQFENTGILTLGIKTTTDDKQAGVKSFDNVEKSLEGFKKHTDLLCNELVSDSELESAKMALKQKITGQFQNPISRNNLILMNMQEPYGIKRIDKYIEAIDKITKEDIQKTAKFIFSYNPTISILASKDTIDSQLDYLKTQGDVSQAA